MELLIQLEEKRAVLEIRQKGDIIDVEGVSYYHDLELKLISALDKLLNRNKIEIISLQAFKIKGNLGKETTSHKIAEAFIAGLKI